MKYTPSRVASCNSSWRSDSVGICPAILRAVPRSCARINPVPAGSHSSNASFSSESVHRLTIIYGAYLLSYLIRKLNINRYEMKSHRKRNSLQPHIGHAFCETGRGYTILKGDSGSKPSGVALGDVTPSFISLSLFNIHYHS